MKSREAKQRCLPHVYWASVRYLPTCSLAKRGEGEKGRWDKKGKRMTTGGG